MDRVSSLALNKEMMVKFNWSVSVPKEDIQAGANVIKTLTAVI
jgi:hypothetical protein